MVLMPFMLFILAKSLQSEDSFSQTKVLLTNPYIKVLLWSFSVALIYHVLAGLRHLLMDIGIGEHLKQGRQSANLVIILAVILAIFLGIWIW